MCFRRLGIQAVFFCGVSSTCSTHAEMLHTTSVVAATLLCACFFPLLHFVRFKPLDRGNPRGSWLRKEATSKLMARLYSDSSDSECISHSAGDQTAAEVSEDIWNYMRLSLIHISEPTRPY